MDTTLPRQAADAADIMDTFSNVCWCMDMADAYEERIGWTTTEAGVERAHDEIAEGAVPSYTNELMTRAHALGVLSETTDDHPGVTISDALMAGVQMVASQYIQNLHRLVQANKEEETE